MTDWTRFENTETEVLIDYYQNKDNLESLRDDAFLALCFRFRKDLLNKCEIICKRKGHNSDVAQEIAENTLRKYGRYPSFKYEEGDQCSVDDRFRFYLNGIAQNELINYFHVEKKRKNGQLYDGTETIVTQFPDVNVDKLSPENKIIHDILMALPYSHQVIYFTYKTYEVAGVNLPKKLQADLRAHLGDIDQKTVRSYKKVVIDKIEEAKRIINELKV